MSTIDSISRAIIGLMYVGILMRIVYVFVQGIFTGEDMSIIKKRVVNAMKFLILATLIFTLKGVIMSYYS